MSISFTDWTTGAAIPSMQWPPVLNTDAARYLLTLNYLKQEGEWLDNAQIQHEQKQQAFLLFQHAKQNSPYYQKTMATVEATTADVLAQLWATLPLVNAQQLQQAGNSFHSRLSPQSHGPSQSYLISHPSGAEFILLKSKISLFFEDVLILRQHGWHQRHYQATYAILHDEESGKTTPEYEPSWGSPINTLVTTGPKTIFYSKDPMAIRSWLESTQAEYLSCDSKQCQDLIDHCLTYGKEGLHLKQLLVPAQGITPALRNMVKEVLGAQLFGYHYTPELGLFAVQCSKTENYHIQVEHVLLETVDEEQKNCPYFTKGRLIATSLHNFSAPLIRYDTGLDAVIYPSCPCNRGSPLLDVSGRIM